MTTHDTAADARALWTTPSLKSGRVGDVTALNFAVIPDGPLFS